MRTGTKSILEVGARNAAAPPWEGKMIAFGDPAAAQSVLYQQNDQIQAAREMGLRFHAARGSLSVGESHGGLPPDSVAARASKFGRGNESRAKLLFISASSRGQSIARPLW